MISTKSHFLQYRPGILFLDPCPIHHFRLVTKNKTAKFIRSFYFVGLQIYELEKNSFKWRYWNVNILGTGLSLCSKSQEKLLLSELLDKKDANSAKG